MAWSKVLYGQLKFHLMCVGGKAWVKIVGLTCAPALKTDWCDGCGPGQEDYCTRKGLRSPSPLRAVAIQTIDIFIKGCYL